MISGTKFSELMRADTAVFTQCSQSRLTRVFYAGKTKKGGQKKRKLTHPNTVFFLKIQCWV